MTRNTQGTDVIERLVQGFAENIKHYKSKNTKEAEVRQQFLDPFWTALGWDVGNTKQVPPTDAEVIIEKTVETAESTGLRSRRPDYLFRLGGFPRFIVEAKKPAVDIDTDREAIFQAKMYAWNSTIPFAILTDFEQFRLFDTTLQPILQEPGRGLVTEFRLDYQQYPAQWDVLTATFGREAVAGGSLERLLAQVKKLKAGRRVRTVDRTLFDLKGSEPVDRVFLAFLDAHRKHFAAAIYQRNKAAFPDAETLHGAAKLTEAVQRIMDRLVFMRILEDRGIITYGDLRAMLERIGSEGGELYESLTSTFREYDKRFNGYLFKPNFSDELKLDGSVLADFIRTLYPPDSPWDFAAIGDDILGIVYERFLGNVVTVTHSHAEIAEKPEVRHAGGVYYTPRFIVDSIIRRVVGPKLAGKTPADVLDVKILDPACGSGSFLVAALQYLFDYCIKAIEADPSLAEAVIPALASQSGGKARKKKSAIAFQDKAGAWNLAPDFRAALLTHCIHGVDIDQQAVEVTVMSLYVKMLESKLPENWATLWVERQLLPTLDNNIQCGNSLIDEESYDAFASFHRRTMFGENADTAFRMNRFDWKSRTRGFGRLLDSQAEATRGRSGFDCIIGNPPYIRVQELNKWAPEECQFYKWKYASAKKGNYDIYVVFTEKGLSLLAKEGLLGFIMPHKFWQGNYGRGLREVIAEGEHLNAVVDFGDQQVFKGATTYTAIHICSKEGNHQNVNYAKVLKLTDGESQITALDAGEELLDTVAFQAVHPRSVNPWTFLNIGNLGFMEKLQTQPQTLGSVASIFVGLQTSADKIYCLSIARNVGEKRNERLAEVRDADGRQWEIEKEITRPFLYDVTVTRYDRPAAAHLLLFPYRRLEKGVSLISVDELKRQFPRAWEYLKHNERTLRSRESGKADHDEWYGFVYRKNLTLFDAPKLIVPVISLRARYGYDDQGIYFSGGGNGPYYGVRWAKPDLAPSLFYLQGLLNSLLLDAFLQRVSSPFRGGYWSYGKRFIEQIPIKLPETATEKKLAERITESVRAIMDAKSNLRAEHLSDGEKRRLESTIETHENRINEAVLKLYGVEDVLAE